MRTDPPIQDPGAIGPYKILGKLGEGGMGVVYLAEQTEPIRRRVAIKLIKLGMDTRQVIARFEAERQALALMNHSGVAKVFDAGVSESGRPYFVMEYVPGIPITDYCDLRSLSVRERLDLFIQVCDAIHHAHQKGIIHRDVKPTNVLVSAEDGKPTLKVIDFGVAKATIQRLTERTLYTEQGILIGTPEYMSPEQARTTALDVDTRTDIYSLGVLLYELLVGALPFDPRTLRRAAMVEMLRIIREEDPPRPTVKFGSLGGAAAEIAKRRHADIPSLARQLRGELEWITMRALEKDPSRRYAAASELGADVRRHLENEPVAAGPPSRSYRLRKFVRRHRAPVAALTASLAVLLGGVVVSTSLYIRSEAARRRAELESARSALEARALQAVALDNGAEYQELSREAMELHLSALGKDSRALALHLVNRLVVLQWVVGGRDPVLAGSEDRRQLERAALDVVHRSLDEGDPNGIKAAVLLAEIIAPVEAEPLARKALALSRRRFSGVNEATTERLERLALRLQTEGPAARGDASIEAVHRETLARRRRVLPSGAPALVESQKELEALLERKGSRLAHGGDFAAAEPVFRESLSLLTEGGREETLRTAKVRSDLGACLAAVGRTREAEPLLLAARRDLESALGRKSAATQEALNRLADLYEATDRPADASRYRALLSGISIGEVSDLGPLPFDGILRNRNGGYSALIDGRSVWVFWDAESVRPGEDGTRSRDATLAWTDDLDAGDGLAVFHERKDRAGVPLQLIPPTPEEAAFDAAHAGPKCSEPCGARWIARPGSIIADPGRNRSLVFYHRDLRQPSSNDEPSGTSLAVCSRGAEGCARPVVRPGTEEPTLLFGAGEPAWGSAALVVGDQLYAYACERPAIGSSCRLARVALGDALDRSEWRFFAAGGRWSGDWREARHVLNADAVLEIHWNPYLGKYLAVSSRTMEARINLRIADRPEGPWSEPVVEVYTVHSTSGWFWTFSGLAHPELARDGGRIEYLTFVRNLGWEREMRLMEVRFRKR